MRIPAGASEHATIVDEMIHDAVRNKKSLYIMTIDFTDAFGSVPHNLIKRNLYNLGFDKNFVKAIMSSYSGSYTKIVSHNRKSKELFFRKGVKQGCPLSPTLFNICIDSLVKKLNECKDDGYHWFDLSTTVQAYADDIIIFSDTEEGMNNLIKVVENFCKFAGHMKINSKKCHSFTYIYHNGNRNVLNDSFTFADGKVENCSIQSSCTYLGLPIAAKAARRKNHVFRCIEEMSNDISRIANSALRFTQAIDAIKRFVIPKIDYELMANNTPTNALNKLDKFIRGRLSKMIKAPGIPIDWFYTAKKDGGPQIQSLIDRQRALTIRLYVSLVTSTDKSVRKVIRASDDAEITFRGAKVNEMSPFLHLQLKQNGSLDSKHNRGTSNLLSRCVKSLHDLNLGLVFNDNSFKLTDLSNDDTSYDVDSKNILKTIMRIINARHAEKLRSFPLKGHSFTTLSNSPLSNFFLKPNSLMADSIVRFAIKARTNSLMTASINPHSSSNTDNANTHAHTKYCRLCNQLLTLHHIINGCSHMKSIYTKRHDAVQDVLRNYLTDIKHVNVHANQTVRGSGSERLTGESSSLKPDLWWWSGNQLSIVEFTIPYGMMSDQDGNNRSTLDIRREEKIDKYNNLLNDCKRQFNCDAKLFVIIVSSLGAIPKESVDELKNITGSEKAAAKLACRMVAAAIRESMLIYYGEKKSSNDTEEEDTNNHHHPHSQSNNDDQNPSDHDHSIDSIDDDLTDTPDHSMNTGDDETWKTLFDSDSVEEIASNQITASRSTDEEYEKDKGNVISSEDCDVLENSGTEPLWTQGSVANTSNSTYDSNVPNVSKVPNASVVPNVPYSAKDSDVEVVQHFTSLQEM